MKISRKEIRMDRNIYEKKILSDKVIDKFYAISYEINQYRNDAFLYSRFIIYLEWFFDKVIEKKVLDKFAKKILLEFRFRRKMDLMKDWGILIDDNFSDVESINEIRNHFAHNLYIDKQKVLKIIKGLKRYSDPQFAKLQDPLDKCIGVVLDILSTFTTVLNSNFSYLPTPKQKTVTKTKSRK